MGLSWSLSQRNYCGFPALILLGKLLKYLFGLQERRIHCLTFKFIFVFGYLRKESYFLCSILLGRISNIKTTFKHLPQLWFVSYGKDASWCTSTCCLLWSTVCRHTLICSGLTERGVGSAGWAVARMRAKRLKFPLISWGGYMPTLFLDNTWWIQLFLQSTFECKKWLVNNMTAWSLRHSPDSHLAPQFSFLTFCMV